MAAGTRRTSQTASRLWSPGPRPESWASRRKHRPRCTALPHVPSSCQALCPQGPREPAAREGNPCLCKRVSSGKQGALGRGGDRGPWVPSLRILSQTTHPRVSWRKYLSDGSPGSCPVTPARVAPALSLYQLAEGDVFPKADSDT